MVHTYIPWIGADALVNGIAHEITESITDSFGAWADDKGNECAGSSCYIYVVIVFHLLYGVVMIILML